MRTYIVRNAIRGIYRRRYIRCDRNAHLRHVKIARNTKRTGQLYASAPLSHIILTFSVIVEWPHENYEMRVRELGAPSRFFMNSFSLSLSLLFAQRMEHTK